MTNEWFYATLPAHWSRGQAEFKWGKKNIWHVSISLEIHWGDSGRKSTETGGENELK